jgi:metal-responsive CopG/Arc/MetJ family transcriptional regulator
MSRERVSISIDKERLIGVDELAEKLDLDRSNTIERIIDIGKPIVEAGHRQQMQWYARQIADAVQEGRVAALPEGVAADADMGEGA